jgi:hypothetical protein
VSLTLAKVVLDVGFFVPELRDSVAWWNDPPVLAAVLRALDRAGLWLDTWHLGAARGGSAPQRVASLDALLARAARWKQQSYTLYADPSGDRGATHLAIDLRAGELTCALSLGGAELDARRATLIDRFVQAVADARSALRGAASLHPRSCAFPLGFAYPRPRPVHNAPPWRLGSFVQFVDADLLDALPPAAAELRGEVMRLLAAPLPALASREDRDGLVVIRWAPDLLDVEGVARGCAAQERWLAAALDAPLAPGWNAAGDAAQPTFNLTRRPPLTFYDPVARLGYKAVAATADGRVDEELLTDLAGWLRAGRLPDGAPLAGVTLIAPRRDAALALRPRARALGLGRVLYIDDGGTLWDPAPPGAWADA